MIDSTLNYQNSSYASMIKCKEVETLVSKILTLLFYMLLIHGITENDTENTDTAVLHVINTWHH